MEELFEPKAFTKPADAFWVKILPGIYHDILNAFSVKSA
jgi:hypothetical protein